MKTTNNSIVAIEGIPFIVLSLVLLICSVLLFVPLYIVFLLLCLTAFCIFFFRNPKRDSKELEANDVVSPADGKIIKIEKIHEGKYLNREVTKISIFMSPLDVHINRTPVSGKVKKMEYFPGKFLIAYKDKSSEDNERNVIVFENKNAIPVMIVQIAGFIARRIVSYLTPGDEVDQSQILGLIRFGSRVDVYLPYGSNILVPLGKRVKAGVTVLATLDNK